jgi:hypothetical protein
MTEYRRHKAEDGSLPSGESKGQTPKLLYNCRESSTNRAFFAKQSQFAGGTK